MSIQARMAMGSHLWPHGNLWPTRYGNYCSVLCNAFRRLSLSVLHICGCVTLTGHKLHPEWGSWGVYEHTKCSLCSGKKNKHLYKGHEKTTDHFYAMNEYWVSSKRRCSCDLPQCRTCVSRGVFTSWVGTSTRFVRKRHPASRRVWTSRIVCPGGGRRRRN